VRALSLRSDADQPAALVAKVDAGELRVDVSGRYPSSDLVVVQDQRAAGQVRGKVLVTPAA
jgi:NADPH:quinone reductase-like Zn-dependent oxidoreductase